jgi:hypothetical protein
MARKAQVAPVAQSNTNAVKDLVTAMFNVADSTLNAKAQAYDLLADLKDVDAVNKVRDEFKAAYAEGYKAKYPSNKAEDCTNACNMAWSRVCAYAKEKGWDKPVADNAKAAKAREARADASKGKVDGRTAKAKGKVEGVVVGKVARAGDELDAAMDVIRNDDMLRAAFNQWFEKAKAAQAALKALAA